MLREIALALFVALMLLSFVKIESPADARPGGRSWRQLDDSM